MPYKSERKAKRTSSSEYGTYCPINDNCWAIVSDCTPVQVRDKLDQSLSDSDRIFVIRSGTAAAWRNVFGEKNTKWLKEYL